MNAKTWDHFTEWYADYLRQCQELQVQAISESRMRHAWEEGLTPHWCAREMNQGPQTTKLTA